MGRGVVAYKFKFFLVFLSIVQFMGFAAQARTCTSVIGAKVLDLDEIIKRIGSGAKGASKLNQGFTVEGALDGYYSAVGVGVHPKKAMELVLKGAKERLHSSALRASSHAYYAAVGMGFSSSDVSKRIEVGRLHQPVFNWKHGQIEGYYLAVVFGVPPIEAAKSIRYNGIHRFPNIKSFKNLLTAFYAGLAFGIPPLEAGDNIAAAYKVEDRVPDRMKNGVSSGFYFSAVIKNDLVIEK